MAAQSESTPDVAQPSEAPSSSAETATATANAAQPEPGPALEPALPPLSPSDFREYNRLADSMTYFHNHFKQTWTLLHTAATTGRRPKNMTLRQFIDTGLGFVRQLTVHHDIEETYVYPQLAPRMDQFRDHHGPGKKTREQSELIRQHREIHEGMDRLEEYLKKCRSGEADLEMAVLKDKMDDWNDVLWTHLDAEVETLGAETMRKYWTLGEMRRLQI